jgi:hypothetical protein
MKFRFPYLVAVIASMTGLPAEAAAIYDFSYQFTEGYSIDRQYHAAMLFTGSFAGTEKNDLIHIEDDIQLYVNGSRILENVTFSASHFLIPELWFKPGDAVASYTGSANNFLFYYQDQSNYERRVFGSIPQGLKGEKRWTFAANYSSAYHSEFIPSSDVSAQWSLTRRVETNEVPEPASLALFGIGAFMASCRVYRTKTSKKN